jgi:hypothetical protein
MKKSIHNKKDGFHVNSKHWKSYKQSLPNVLPQDLFQVCVGIILGDATLYKTVTSGVKLKVEQGFKHKEYVEHLFYLFKDWTFYEKPYDYIPKGKSSEISEVKSVSFKTFAHVAFIPLWNLFMENSKKVYKKGTIQNHLTLKGLCYWIADDGSLHKTKSIILHTQSFSKEENLCMCKELNHKFNLCTKVIIHKEKYRVIYIPVKDVKFLKNNVCMPESMKHKLS